jgi:adenine-specific DNA methylase
MMDPENKSFIETQFPVSKLSKESYKERKANLGQTLTGLGKWWGRKPLVLVRAALLGLLLPATADPRRDREIFLRLMTMDEAGLWRRKSKNIPLKELYARLSEKEREGWFTRTSTPDKPKYRQAIKAKDKLDLQRLVFQSLSYDDKLEYCLRPEHLDGPSPEAWDEINPYLGTSAQSLPELIRQLGERRFGHVPRVGDVFCGGGSIPFEAARLGCDVYASDLSPVAALLTWAALNIVGGGPEVAQKVREAQEKVYAAVDSQVTAWGIEHNEQGWRADAYLYCIETQCPECGVMVPLAPSWVIGEGTKTIAVMEFNEPEQRFDLRIRSGVSAKEMDAAKKAGTVKSNSLHCPACKKSTPFTMLRSDRRTGEGTQYGLRLWENDDLVPRPEDVFQERLYCIRWVETYIEDGKEKTHRYYRPPEGPDIEREASVLTLLRERFHDWQAKGYLPSSPIEPGEKTDEPIRTRGWTCWHHLFNPRQLLINGLFSYEAALCSLPDKESFVGFLLGASRCYDYNAKLSRWHSHGANEKSEQVFSNQALNTLLNYGVRTTLSLKTSFFIDCPIMDFDGFSEVETADVRNISQDCHIWITDPSYADAINYHELSEFFLSWYEKILQLIFPDWQTNSRRALAITGKDEHFRRSMVAAYRNLTAHMPDNGMQVVMFTHQDVKVWADLALILWASGLRVTAAWTIGTETESSLKQGNYVQGTVLLVLRKRTSQDTAYRDEISVLIEKEVKAQLDSMLALDDQEDPNFGDTDYQLAAYAAALRVLTQYQKIEDLDIEHELSRPRLRGETSPIEEIIQDAVQTACDYLIPKGFDAQAWKHLTPEERFYLKGLELESHGERRVGVYQELARGFGVREYQPFLATTQANQTRCKTATEFGNRNLGGDGFGSSLVRQGLFAVREAARTREATSGRDWLKTELPDYWNQRKKLVVVLNYLATMALKLESWRQDGEAARLVAGAVENDHI